MPQAAVHRTVDEAFAASDHVGSGQLAVLSQTLDRVAAETSPDRVIEHVLRAIARQLGAQSCSVWWRSEDGLFALQAALESDRFLLPTDPSFRGTNLRIAMDPYWRDAIEGGRAAIMEDIRALQDSEWRARLTALGVVTVMMVPMTIQGVVRGCVGVRFTSRRKFIATEITLARALVTQVTFALLLARLSAQARESAVIAERNRMARDIHDTLAQGFTGVIVQLEAASDATAQGLGHEAATHVDRARQLARESLAEARRSVLALRQRDADGRDLASAIEAMLVRITAGTRLKPVFRLRGKPAQLPLAWEENLLRISQEAVTNSLRHAGAKRFSATLSFFVDEVRLTLADDGKGLATGPRREGLGLVGIAERAAAMGGRHKLSSRTGAGVTLRISIPLRSAPPGVAA